MSLTRRGFVKLGLSSVAALVLQGCGGGSPKPEEQPTPLPTSTPVPATPTPECLSRPYVGDLPYMPQEYRGLLYDTPSPQYIRALFELNVVVAKQYGAEVPMIDIFRRYFIENGVAIPDIPVQDNGFIYWPVRMGFSNENERLFVEFLDKDSEGTLTYKRALLPEHQACSTPKSAFSDALYELWTNYMDYVKPYGPEEGITYYLAPNGETANRVNSATMAPILTQPN